MLSKAQIRLIRSLRAGKFRNIHGLFVAEGPKLVKELLQSQLTVNSVYAIESWASANADDYIRSGLEINLITPSELSKISNLSTPNEVLALAVIPFYTLQHNDLQSGLSILLDDLRDPGNMGTIIRLADWFGIERIICSPETVDVFNPKVVQSTMGSIARVHVYYEDLKEIIRKNRTRIPVYCTAMEGQELYSAKLPPDALIVIGNESKGVSPEISAISDHKLAIPSFRPGAESLNASVAAAIIISEFKRSNITRTNNENDC